jgi:dipeptidyl aminopeptidase/acylaminoacyl peptidase
MPSIVRIVAVALLAALPSAACAQPSPPAPAADGAILDTQPVSFPSASDIEDLEYFSTDEEFDAAAADERFRFERITYSSDGLPVVAFVYRPSAPPEAPRPAVIFNRGSWTVDDTAPEMLTLFHSLADAGFTVIAPMLRGSEGAPGRDELGGAERADIHACLTLVANLGGVDLDNLFLAGESRGGMMTFQMLRERFPVRAAATWGAFTDLDALIASDPASFDPLARAIWPDFDDRRAEITDARSATRWAGEIAHTPLLLMHGGADETVPASHTESLAEALRAAGAEPRVVLYPGDNHVLTASRNERNRAMIEWFNAHLR